MNYEYLCSNYYDYCDDFRAGIDLLRKGKVDEAVKYFELAYESVKNRETYHDKYASFCGLTRVLTGDTSGLVLCRDAVIGEEGDADLYLNLARAEWYFKNRKKGVDAILDGLDVNPRHPGLNVMVKELRVRRRNALPLLARKNPINVFIGRLMRKKRQLDNESQVD